MEIDEIKQMPTVIDNVHESCYQSYHILEFVKSMIHRKDSIESIRQMICYLQMPKSKN